MNDEIREILDEMINSKDYQDYKIYGKRLKEIGKLLLDYITNLQNEIQKKEAMYDSLAVDYRLAQEENERLKAKCNNSTSHQINYEYFKTLYSKASRDIVIDDLVYKCEDIQKLIEANEKLDIEKNDYKSRVEKVVEYINIFKNDIRGIDEIVLLNILQNGSDEE